MKLRGAWRRDYSEFFDTQEALLIDAMDNADSIYTVFARLQSLAVKCGCAGKLLLHDSVPYTDEMLAAVTKKTVPAFRQCVQPLVQLGLVICEDGIYAIADWEFNQNAPAIDAMREGNRVRIASDRARKNGKGTRQLKKDKVLAYLTEHPEATNTEVAEKTGVSRPSVIKYRREYRNGALSHGGSPLGGVCDTVREFPQHRAGQGRRTARVRSDKQGMRKGRF